MASVASTSSLPLGKVLASTEKKTRDKAIKGLSAFLSQNSENEISDQEMNKLWKGIFYCFWMSDKPLVQQALASELAEMVLTITSNASSIAFLQGFWKTLIREWSGIDQLRLDKYYLLVRRFVNASFRLLARAKWDLDICSQYNEILSSQGGPLCPTDIKIPPGLLYHLSDVYLDELNKVLVDIPPLDKPAPLIVLLSPFISLSAQTTSKVTFKRLKTVVLEPVMSAFSNDDASDDEEERPRKRTRLEKDGSYSGLRRSSCLADPSEGRLDKVTLSRGVRRKIFEAASDPETRDSNRRQLYALWKEGGVDSDDE